MSSVVLSLIVEVSIVSVEPGNTEIPAPSSVAVLFEMVESKTSAVPPFRANPPPNLDEVLPSIELSLISMKPVDE